MQLTLGKHSLDLARPQVMGVLNVTPDSFSDGGQFFDAETAVRHAEAMHAEGASIIDIGGESTRPGAADVSVQDELDRIMPIVESLADRVEVALSVDTSKPEVIIAAAAAGAVLINDVFALQRDGAMAAAASTECAICLMHMQGKPGSMQKNPVYGDIAEEVGQFLAERVQACVAAGIAADRLIIDPGFGFGKTDAHNVKLLGELGRLQSIGRPLLVGLSRKRTLGILTDRVVTDRMPAGLAAAVMAYERGAAIIRTHDVAPTVDALKVAAAVMEATHE